MRVVVIGDSLAAGMGLGRRGARFGPVAAAELRPDAFLDLSRPSRTTSDAVAMLDKVAEFRPTVAFVCCGGTEALVHPGAGVQKLIERFAPKSWHGVAGLHPQTHYSSIRGRRVRQFASSWARVATKHVLVRCTRAEPRVPPAEFGASLSALLQGLDELGCRTYVVAMCHIDDALFPKSERALAEANVEIDRAVKATDSAKVVSVRDEMLYWDDFLPDHAHWSVSGHRRLATKLVAAVQTDDLAGPACVQAERVVDEV